MSIQAQRPTPQEVVTQENLLLATAERIGRIREGRSAIHFHLSKLRPHNRQESHLRIAARMLEPLGALNRGQVFVLSNADIVVLCKEVAAAELDHAIYRLRALFSKDPLTFADTGDGRDRFVTWYDIESDYAEFFALARHLDEEARRRQREARSQTRLEPITATTLAQVLDRLAGTDIAGLIRRQSAIAITGDHAAEVLFQEFYVAVAELQRAIAPGTNLLGNRWLFQHLSQVLDTRVLPVLQDTALRQLPPRISINLNLATLFTAVFREFERWAAGRIGLVIELQVLDVFADMGGFVFARDMLRESGHRVLLDGVTGLTLQLMDLADYDADHVKLHWSPDLPDSDMGGAVKVAFDRIGVERGVLARCDSEQAIQWGMQLGLQHFQGRYVDSMIAAMKMARCDQAAACTLGQCTQRHGVIAGGLRAECGNLDVLDSSPLLRAPRRRPPGGA